MKNIFWRISIILIILFSLNVFSSNAQITDFSRLIAKRFAKQWVNSPQEKAYLQTDKPFYSAGEDIWFKGYVVNATTHIPKTLSQFLYVELIDKSNTVLSRVKIKRDSLGFSGCIKLKPDQQPGNYALRAYTYWMRNATPDFFFSKSIYIGNPIDDFITSQISFGAIANGKIAATINFMDISKNPISGKNVDVSQNWNNPQNKTNTLITTKDGKINLQLSADTTNRATKIIDVSIVDPGFRYKKRFFLPEFKKDFDFQFFPESGPMLTNILQVIGFKAVGSDGLAVDVSGKVYTEKNEEVAEFATSNKGMGKLTLQVQSGEKYHAIVKSAGGIEKVINLPATQDEGVGLHLVYNRDRILYEVINKLPQPDKVLYLLVHSRGKVFILQRLTEFEGQISESLLPAGIVSFSVIDSLGKTYCERLSFVRETDMPLVKMESDKAVYGKREPVNLSFNINSSTGVPFVGNYSVSVTDSHSVQQDSLSDNILSYLLLSSDIKGYVEDPASYFTKNTLLDHERVDLLMLTQAWRRFNTDEVVKGKYKDSPYYLEAGQALSGKVMGLFNKPSKKCGIIMLSGYKNVIKLAETDSLGRYFIDGIEFPDSTSFVLKAKKPKSLTDVEVIPDEDDFPKSEVYIPTPLKASIDSHDEYFKQSKAKYYTDGGMRMVNLEGVTVKAAKKDKQTQTHYYSGMEDTKMTSEKLEDYPGMGVLDILSMMPGIQVDGTNVSIRGSSNNPLFLIDEIESMSMDDITYLTSNDIEDILVFKGANAAIFGSKGGNGVIAISLKKGVMRKPETPVSLVTVKPLGYQKTAQFYMPKYQVDSVKLNGKSDLRTTIYWNPKLVSDNTGKVHMRFFTADKANNYTVVLEGLTNKGEICRYVGYLRREGN